MMPQLIVTALAVGLILSMALVYYWLLAKCTDRPLVPEEALLPNVF